MSILPTIQNIAGKITTTAQNVANTLPVFVSNVQATVDSVNAIAKGKQPAPSPSQQPATVEELVPRNVGGLNLSFAQGASSGFLILAVVAGLVIVFYGMRRR